MPKISILSDQVANQVAAGEVIERPVAVIKELLENSLDAGATSVVIEFQNGGKNYMRVEDDGCGMSPDDALLCLERHATSKIKEASDLIKIRSFGFRGEAIPSIASISRFTLRTRSKDFPCGCEILINAGKMIHRKDYGMRVGTQIEVANLFNSVPVRRKFLKTDNTEAAHITHLVRLYAVGHPNVTFTLIENGKTLFKSFASQNLIDRVCGVWNQKLSKELIYIDVREGDMHLFGLINKPGVGRSTRQEMITFVNNRPVDSKTLDYALIESYHTFIPKSRYPIVFLFLEVNPELVDVNVHPAKREIRFRNEALIRQFVITNLLSRLNAFNQEITQINPLEKEQTSIPLPQVIPQPQRITFTQNIFPKPGAPSPLIESTSGRSAQLINVALSNISNCDSTASAFLADIEVGALETAASEKEFCSSAIPLPLEEEKKPAFIFNSWKFIGGLSGIYGLFESSNGLIVMNFKRVRQRILFERIQKSFKEGESEYFQPLLFPIPISLDSLTSAAFESHLAILNRAGLKIELFGRNFYRIEAVPSWLEPELAERFVKDAAALIREQGIIPKANDFLYEKMAKLAVLETLKFEELPKDEQIDLLVQELFSCQNPLNCPRGTLTYFELSGREIQKRLGSLL